MQNKGHEGSWVLWHNFSSLQFSMPKLKRQSKQNNN